MDTITLVSHTGARAACGFGPQDFPLIHTIPVTTINGVRYAEPAIPQNGDLRLLIGVPISHALRDIEGTVLPGATIAFDGDLPWYDGRLPAPLWFDDTHVYRAAGFPIMPVVQVAQRRKGPWGGYEDIGRVRHLEEPGLEWIHVVAGLGRDRTVWSDLLAPRRRVVYSIFELDGLGAGVIPPDVVIHDESRAREWFDPIMAIRGRMEAAERAARNLHQRLSEASAQVQSVIDGTWLPERLHVGRDGRPSPNVSVDLSAAHNLLVLRWLDELFSHPVGEVFGGDHG